jgi:hypothetical protein
LPSGKDYLISGRARVVRQVIALAVILLEAFADVGGKNYLIAVDATLAKVSARALEAIPLDAALEQLDLAHRLRPESRTFEVQQAAARDALGGEVSAWAASAVSVANAGFPVVDPRALVFFPTDTTSREMSDGLLWCQPGRRDGCAQPHGRALDN